MKVNCRTGERRQHTGEELQQIEAALAAEPARVPRPIEWFADVGIVEFTDALLSSMVQEGVIPTTAKAQAIAQRMRNKLTR